MGISTCDGCEIHSSETMLLRVRSGIPSNQLFEFSDPASIYRSFIVISRKIYTGNNAKSVSDRSADKRSKYLHEFSMENFTCIWHSSAQRYVSENVSIPNKTCTK